MATIAENLQTLNETKTAIKTAIENKGQDMTDVPFTSYADKITAIEGVNKSDVIKQLIDAKGEANYLFKNSIKSYDFLNDFLRYDTTENAKSLENFLANPARIDFYIPLIDTRKVTHVVYCLDYAQNLKRIPAWDLRSVISGMSEFCRYTQQLEEIWIKNIGKSFSVYWSSSLKVECIIHLIRELRDMNSALTLTIGSANIAKITGDNAVYVRIIDITDEMRAEDDLIDEKLPFEICESTDEGAMLITEYAQLKNWQIA